MGLWYNSGQGFKPFSLERKALGLDVFFCCPGPSLKFINPKILNGAGRMVAAVNNSYPFVKPDIWFAMDDPNCYSREVFWEPFIKIMRGGYQDRTCADREIDSNYNLYYADVKKYDSKNAIFNTKGEDVKFVWEKNVMATAFNVLFWMGAKRIYMIGCDLDNSKSDYHHGQKLSDKNKNWNKRLYSDLFGWMKWLTEESVNYGIEIKSATENSKINTFMEYVPLKEAIELSEKDIPKGGDLKHTLDVKKK